MSLISPKIRKVDMAHCFTQGLEYDHLFGIVVSKSAIQEVAGSIPGYALEIFLELKGLERGPPSLVRTIG